MGSPSPTSTLIFTLSSVDGLTATKNQSIKRKKTKHSIVRNVASKDALLSATAAVAAAVRHCRHPCAVDRNIPTVFILRLAKLKNLRTECL